MYITFSKHDDRDVSATSARQQMALFTNFYYAHLRYDYGRSEYHNMFVTCEERVVCTGCCSGVTGSHGLLGYFDFAALLRGESTDRGVGNLRGARTQLLLLQLLCLRQSCLHWYT